MANLLSAARGDAPVGENWTERYIKRTDAIKTRVRRKYDYQRAKCEDPRVIAPWFTLVANTKAKYGILDDDIFNFDESGFQMGQMGHGMVVTATERKSRPKHVQPGNTEWVTVVAAINAAGWTLPPTIIFKAKTADPAWWQHPDVPRDWRLEYSKKGWTDNAIGQRWIEHFDAYTRPRTKGKWRLLILDGHGSHNTAVFDAYCKERDIMPLYMPTHSSHLLQPLDVGCFGPMKIAYGDQLCDLIRCYIHHVCKLTFLDIFKPVFNAVFTASNVQGAFAGSGLVLLDAQRVLCKLDVIVDPPTPPAPPASPPLPEQAD
jgi:hypothetical protein